MRMNTLAVAFVAMALSTRALPVASDELDMLTQDMSAQVSGKVNKVVDGYSELCDAIRQQMIARLEARKDFCPIPMVDPKAHIRRPDWQSVDVDGAKDLLARALPDLLSAGQPHREIWSQHPEYSPAQIADSFWSRYGDAILAVLKRNPRFLEKATLDVDNNGKVEDVYRVAAAKPVDPKNPSGPWATYSCNGAYPDGYPVYGFFFLPGTSAEMGTISRIGIGWDLFRYRARTFMTSISNSFAVSAYWLKSREGPGGSGQTLGFSAQACFIRLDPE